MSSAVDDDVAETVAEGREHLGTMLSTAQTHLQKVFILFVVGLIGTIYVLRAFVWQRLKADLNVNDAIDIVAITPFEVILLQVKIGLVVGVLLTIPPLVYYSRDSLRRRGRWPDRLPRWKAAGFGVVSLLLFAGGVAYSYNLFFPLMLDFLASNAVSAEFEPNYSISMWAQFIILLSLSFGLAAQLPLVMSSLAYGEIVRYETFRDKWRYAIIGIFAFGALFSPPDPFTQIMWAVPLVTLYGLSLYLTKVIVTAKRSSDSVDVPATARDRWNLLAGLAVAGAGLAYGFYAGGGDELLNRGLAAADSSYRFLPPGAAYGLPAQTYLAVVGAVYGLAFAVAGLGYAVYAELEALETDEFAAADAAAGDPADIDLSELDEAGIRAAPAAAFARLEEEEALAMASEAMDDDDPERAQAILDRFDNVHTDDGDVTPSDVDGGPPGDPDSAAAATADDADDADDEDDEGGILARRGAGVLDAFSEDDIDEDDVGGYAYDIAFIADSLTSKSFYLVGLFMAVMAATFFTLYRGGIAVLQEQFTRRMSEEAAAQVEVVTLQPVEALIFMVKVSVIFGIAATLPLLLYYAWPALKERGFAGGDRRVLLAWGGTLLTGLTLGSLLGFFYVAPATISWLAADVLDAGMLVRYRVNNYGWLVFFLTVGIGILAMIPVSMLLFYKGNLVSYRTMRGRWREVTLVVFGAAAFLSPGGVFTMFILAIPIVAVYLLGLGCLWLLTLGGRRSPGPAEPAD
ncbi:preprotein translocase subunit TatC [Halobacteriales archaeon QS_8_69_73]|nr:MAG: preprotein translocase subunit TatC [Halobacteriales archaeon QS_8_69_73]